MTKQEFLNQLRVATGDSIVAYYDELISDRIEAGENEDMVVSSYDVKKIAKALKFDIAKKELEQVSAEKKKRKGTVVIVALCAFPVTLPLGIALCAIVFALVVTALALLVAGVAGTLWVIVGTGSLIATGESIGFILLNLGASLIALGIVGVIGCYGFIGIKKFYNWLMVTFFKKVKNRGEKNENI